MNCKEPFLELAKVKRSYAEKQEKVNKLLMGKNCKDLETEQAQIHISKEPQHQTETVLSERPMRAHRFRVEDVLEKVIEATKEEENLFVGFVKKINLREEALAFMKNMNKQQLVDFLMSNGD